MRHLLTISFSLFAGLLLFSCSQLPTQYEPDFPDYNYTFHIPALHKDSVSISLTIKNNSRLALPVHFFDNPLLPVTGSVIRDLQIADSEGNTVDTICTIERIGPIDNQVIEFSSDTRFPVTLSYRLNSDAFSNDTANTLIPQLQISDSLLFLIGASCFIIPYRGNSLVDIWRTPLYSRVNIKSEVQIYGIPSDNFSCATVYELLFLQILAGPPVIAEGFGGGVNFAFLDLMDIEYGSDIRTALTTNFTIILNEITRSYGPLKGENYTIAIQNIKGGLEGSYGFSILQPNISTESRFQEVLTHEVLHNFIGIRCGEYDDPWWKEASATYLGAVLTVKLGFYSKELFKNRITTVTSPDSTRPPIALSDPWLRGNMFAEGVHGLAYDKGSQVMMLLDLRVRLASNNRHSINDVTAYLTRRFDNSAFYRQDFIEAFRGFGDADVSDIFSVFVDSAGTVITDTLLQSAFISLDSLKAFE